MKRTGNRKIDEVLIQQVEELLCGETCHLGADLIGVYRSPLRKSRAPAIPVSGRLPRRPRKHYGFC